MSSQTEPLQTPIIIDLGSGEIKAGFGGQERPKIIFKNQLGEPKYKIILKKYDKNNTPVKDIYIGEKCDACLSALKLRNPVEHGIFKNSEDILPIFNHIFTRLKLDSEEIKNHPILIS
jgi:actin-related protein